MGPSQRPLWWPSWCGVGGRGLLAGAPGCTQPGLLGPCWREGTPGRPRRPNSEVDPRQDPCFGDAVSVVSASYNCDTLLCSRWAPALPARAGMQAWTPVTDPVVYNREII